MLLTAIDRLGEINPQLFRELKGRLKPRFIWLAIATSVIVQMLFLKVFTDLLPNDSYCALDAAKNCMRDLTGTNVTNWQKWWQDILRVVNWVLPFLLTVPSVYMLIIDVQQEESRGTLNFVRLSPQSANSILLGKLFGVPAIVYLGVATLLPLHLMAAIGSGGSALGFLLSYYVLIGAGSYVLFSIALLFGCLTKSPTMLNAQFASGASLVSVLVVIFVIVPFYLNWNIFTAWSSVPQYLWFEARASIDSSDLPQWFYLSLKNSFIAHIFTLVNLAVVNYWVWQALNRRFHTPNNTLFGKGQSYGLVACSQVLMLGFCITRYWVDRSSASIGLVIAICFVNVLWFLCLMLMISPERPTVIDWARYRRDRQTKQGRFWQRSLLQDLLWNDKSPAVLAMAVNLLISSVILLPWILTFPKSSDRVGAMMGLVFSFTLLTLYAVIVQWMLLLKTPKRSQLAVSTVMLAMLGSPLLAGLLAIPSGGVAASELLLFSPFFWVALQQASVSTICLSLLGEWIMLVSLGTQLTRSVRRLGTSETTALLSGTRSDR